MCVKHMKRCHTNFDCFVPELFVGKGFPFLAATPDGLI